MSSSAIPNTLNSSYLTAFISQSALEHNIATLRNQLSPGTKICGVVKANCYGHGWNPCLPIIAQQVDFLAVATLEEAKSVALRHFDRSLLAFAVPAAANNERIAEVIELGVSLTVTSEADWHIVQAAASHVGRMADVHVKVDSGMARSGVWHESAVELIRKTQSQPNIKVTGIYTHFASADETDKEATHQQFARFMKIVDSLDQRDGVLLHANNSAATIDLPDYQLDMVRPGIAMYGYQPSTEIHQRLDLKPALRLTGRLVAIKEVPEGTEVGYGRTYQCPQNQRLGLVQVGYADGYQRGYSNQAQMNLRGHSVPVRGRVSMDQTVIDISDIDDATIGDSVEIISSDPSAPNSVESLAKLADVIPYEVICGLGDRIDRVLVE